MDLALGKKRLRILVFTKVFGTPTLTFIYDEIKMLSERHEVRLVCLRQDDPVGFPFGEISVIPVSESIILTKLRYRLAKWNCRLGHYNRRFSRDLGALIDEFQPDLVHCHFGPDALFFWENLRGRFLPMSIVFHGYDASKLLQTSIIYQKELQRLAKDRRVAAIFVSDFLQKNANHNGIRFHQEEVIYLGCNTRKFERRNYAKSDPPIFLQISSFREKKGHRYTLEAFARFRKNQPETKVQLVLAGDGPLRSEMIQLAVALGIAEQVHFPGWVSHEGAKEWMEKASVFVHHSITDREGDTEGLPTVLKEAMAMELPVLSTVHSGIPELVKDGRDGYLVPEKDVEAYAESMMRIANWTYLSASRKIIDEQFSQTRHFDRLDAFFRSMVNNQSDQ